jgi:hypothetical protein
LPDPTDFPEELLKRRDMERDFLSQLLDGSKVEPYNLPVKINAELRKYQQDGVNWLAFLAKYQLHGILCDGAPDHIQYFLDLIFSRYGIRENPTIHLHFVEQAFRTCAEVCAVKIA